MFDEIKAFFGEQLFVAGAAFRLPGCAVMQCLRPVGMGIPEAVKADKSITVNSRAFENLVASGKIIHTSNGYTFPDC